VVVPSPVDAAAAQGANPQPGSVTPPQAALPVPLPGASSGSAALPDEIKAGAPPAVRPASSAASADATGRPGVGDRNGTAGTGVAVGPDSASSHAKQASRPGTRETDASTNSSSAAAAREQYLHPVPPPVPAARPGTQAQPVPADNQPATAREACANRGFFAQAICMDDRCEEARYRNTEECAGILARKRTREGH
jgi:hypothetical protein